MTLKDVLKRAIEELEDTHEPRGTCDCDKVRENIQHIVINTEHVLFELNIRTK